jgi:hypothetical protein
MQKKVLNKKPVWYSGQVFLFVPFSINIEILFSTYPFGFEEVICAD